jgi:hypothetical protein
MKISIDDDLHDRITAVHKQHTPQMITRVLETLPLMERGRTLTLDAAQIGRLETLLAGGSLQGGGDLCRKVENLAHFEVGNVAVDFDATDYDRLAQRATRIGLSIPEYLKLMLDRFKEEWMMIGEPTLTER